LIQHMQFKRVFITDAARALCQSHEHAEYPMARLIQQARIYSQFKVLSAHRLIDAEEGKTMLRHTQLPVAEIEKLKKLNLATLPLNMKPEIDDLD